MTILEEIIAQQQKGHENEPRFMIGEQLKEIAAREPRSAELLAQDLTVPEMDLGAAEKKLQEYADKHHKSGRTFCISPIVAEGILRKFYGLPEAGDAGAAPVPSGDIVELSDFL